ncbi:MAG TPA: hypothetical protein VGB47_11615 [Thermoanaerobaculia bacterium]|jgi:hypothetical protein
MVERVAGIEKRLGIYDLAQYPQGVRGAALARWLATDAPAGARTDFSVVLQLPLLLIEGAGTGVARRPARGRLIRSR